MPNYFIPVTDRNNITRVIPYKAAEILAKTGAAEDYVIDFSDPHVEQIKATQSTTEGRPLTYKAKVRAEGELLKRYNQNRNEFVPRMDVKMFDPQIQSKPNMNDVQDTQLNKKVEDLSNQVQVLAEVFSKYIESANKDNPNGDAETETKAQYGKKRGRKPKSEADQVTTVETSDNENKTDIDNQ